MLITLMGREEKRIEECRMAEGGKEETVGPAVFARGPRTKRRQTKPKRLRARPPIDKNIFRWAGGGA
jgi:hypothetical protein